MKPKKTINIEEFKEFINTQLARTDEFSNANPDFKNALCMTLENMLQKTGNYKGYNNLYWLEGGCNEWEKDGKIETWPEKDKYIYGEKGSKYNGNPYARRYY